MNLIQYNDQTTLGFEHVPILASSNVVTGTKYYTKIYLIQGSSRYPIGESDDQLDEFGVKELFSSTMNMYKERQYGTQRPLLRRDLPRRSQVGQVSRGITRSILS